MFCMRREIDHWWLQAKADERTAKNSLASEDYYAAVFWCQQAAEKALKAVCLVKFKKTPPGHSIVHLAHEAKAPAALLTGIRDLNPEYVITRYPDAAEGVPAELYDRTIAERHLKTVAEVMAWAGPQLTPKP